VLQDSSLVTDEEDLLLEWVTEAAGSKCVFKLLWKGSRDGFTAEAFHSRCDNKGLTLTLIQSSFNKVFGGYTSVPWQSRADSKFEDDKNAFIFSLTMKVKCKHQKKINASVLGKKGFGPIFGAGPDIRVADRCDRKDVCENMVNGNQVFELPEGADPNTYLAGGPKPVITEIEVFQVITL
jgi:hypothetical protein